MFIYKITNKINGKVYIGQTIRSLEIRWAEHKYSKKTAISKAIQKYGEENFKIEEIDGANSQSELNYKEWLLIHKFNSLDRNKGYNSTEGGGAGGRRSEESKLRSKIALKKSQNKKSGSKNSNSKKVINTSTKEVFESALGAYKKSGLTISYVTFRDKLNAKIGNETDFRYLNNPLYKKPVGKSHKGRNNPRARQVLDRVSGKKWHTLKSAAKDLNISCNTLRKYCKEKTRYVYIK